MIRAAANDLAQRILTANKRSQRRNLSGLLGGIPKPARAKALDFGCGTGLFAPVFLGCGFSYVGYDVDEDMAAHASRVYKQARFLVHRDEVAVEAPFSVVVANCCFHHIEDADAECELEFLSQTLSPKGAFLFLDILKVPEDPSFLHRQFMKLEQGRHVREEEGYTDLIRRYFTIREKRVFQDRPFSMEWAGCPIGNDLLVLVCSAKGSK